LWATDQPGNLVYDNVENAVTFEVDTANLYKSNLVIDSRFGIVYFPQKWDLAGMSGRTEESSNNVASFNESLPR
jgi:hypothetical protein